MHADVIKNKKYKGVVVHKYGGTSMGSIDKIKNVARRIAKWQKAGYQVLAVCSAMAGETNRLLELAKAFSAKNCSERELDVIASTGEQVSIALLSLALQDIGVLAISYAGWQIKLKTDSIHFNANILSLENIDTKKIIAQLNADKVVVIAGFQGVDDLGEITTLGRGGSDTSAIALAIAMGVEKCFIYTDVAGVYNSDPNVDPDATLFSKISCAQMLEMAKMGSKVLQLRAVQLAKEYNLSIQVLSSFLDPDIELEVERNLGTLIDPKIKKMQTEFISL